MVAVPSRSLSPDDPLRSGTDLLRCASRPDLPTMYDLPSESLEEPGLPDEFHDLQPQLLSRTLQLTGYRRDNYFTASDLNLYYDPDHLQWYKRADWFLAVDVPRLYAGNDLRRSYVTWDEQHPPTVVIEFLSAGTETEDLGRFHAKAKESLEAESIGVNEDAADAEEQQKPPNKFAVYEQYLRIPHYLVYSRQSRQLRYFQLVQDKYQEQPLNAGNPLVWLSDLEIGLGVWEGMFDEVPGVWLRWCDCQGNWFPTDTEQERFAKLEAEQQAEQERLAKQQAEQQAEQERLAKQQAEQQAEQERLAKQQAEQQAEQERLAKQQAEQQAEQERLAKEQAQSQLLQAAQNLLTTGMEMEQVAGLLNLSVEQVQWLRDLQK